jgi:hypothetical protein
MAQRAEYWSCSKFADWIRGTEKLSHGTSDEWAEWEQTARLKKVRYWLAEEGLSALQDFVNWIPDRLHSVKYYVNNRWVTKTHALTAHSQDIKPGTWCDLGYRFLPAMFNELQEFVETELAWWHIAWDDEAKKKFKAPFWARGWWRVRTWRCPEAGLANLEWQMALTENGQPTQQAIDAREIHDLYIWWTEIYRTRPSTHDASGWSQVVDEIEKTVGGEHLLSLFSKKIPEDLRDKKRKATKNMDRIDRDYEAEETDMMIRLIKIRFRLWT